MHLLAAQPGGLDDGESVVTSLGQTAAQVVVLSAADTTLALLASACEHWHARATPLPPAPGTSPESNPGDGPPSALPSLRLAHLGHLRQHASLDLYMQEVLQHARLIIVDHLGGESYWPYGTQQLVELAHTRGVQLVMFSGDTTPDEQLTRKSTAHPTHCHTLWRYLREGGAGNARQFLLYAWRVMLGHALPALGELRPVQVLPPVAIYHPAQTIAQVQTWQHGPHDGANAANAHADAAAHAPDALRWRDGAPLALLVFYRAHLQSGNTAVFDAICRALLAQGVNPLPLAVTSLKDAHSLAVLRSLCDTLAVDIVLNTTAFAHTSLANGPVTMQQAGERNGHDAHAPPSARQGDAGAQAFTDPLAGALAGDRPVLQLILAGSSRQAWQAHAHGLRASDIAMHIALPEVDGRIITRAVSFKARARHSALTQSDVVHYEGDDERIAWVAELARRWCHLRRTPNAAKRLALVLASYPGGSEGRIGNGVGLDTPASAAAILAALHAAGYTVSHATGPDGPSQGALPGDIPPDGAALMRQLLQGSTNDLEHSRLRRAAQSLSMQDYLAFWHALPEAARQAVLQRWGPPEADPSLRPDPRGAAPRFPIAGLRLGRVFVGIQPLRTRPGADVAATYHDAELVPPHSYLAFYAWLRRVWAVDAIVHVGKHGNLEWLPGKSVALCANCWPDLVLGPLPHLYPFIVNDPGEGAQAKRRTQAVIIDHLMPALTRAESHGPLRDLERMVDEYYEALTLDRRRAQSLREQILLLILQARLHHDLGLERPRTESDTHTLLQRTDAYLCELKERQIRDGLHTFGHTPEPALLADTLLALARHPVGDGKGPCDSLTRAIAQDLALCVALPPPPPLPSAPPPGQAPDHAAQTTHRQSSSAAKAGAGADFHTPWPVFDPLHTGEDSARPWPGPRPALLCAIDPQPWRTGADTRERIEQLALHWMRQLVGASPAAAPSLPPDGFIPQPWADEDSSLRPVRPTGGADLGPWPGVCADFARRFPRSAAVLWRVRGDLLPRLLHSAAQEMRHLLRGLQGQFVPAGPSGAPTRGRPDVLPTGRNFYSVDTRALPTPTSWALGQAAAAALVQRYTQEHGQYPRSVGLSVWGTATMRTGGDDIAQAMALIGVRPRWASASWRVQGFDILPLAHLGRPRVDVTLRVSGFFRDAFPALIHLFDAAVQAVAALQDESPEDNPIRARILRSTEALTAQGLDAAQARRRAGWRIFGSRAGSYGSGLQGLLDSGQWTSSAELGDAWAQHSAYAYGQHDHGSPAADVLPGQLAALQAILHNRDNAEHDLLDSADYALFQGGMAAAARHFAHQGRSSGDAPTDSTGGAAKGPTDGPALFVGDHSQSHAPRLHSLAGEISRTIRARVTNPKWTAGLRRHGYKGAFEAAATVDYLFAYDATTGIVRDDQYERVTDALVLDPTMRHFYRQHNPQALHDICTRLLEAMQRGLWQHPGPYQRHLTDTLLDAEGWVEGQQPH